ncbi:MAG TPA: DUF397 domain-containing protein [Pseudonocardiaceae bacterium]|jgi:hypothetical protein|nr:DUF397 domain-containing protein [Pseudonocardiaceae bacterium]
MTSDHTWRKSRRSQNDANCVEVRHMLDQLRDSKNPASVLRVDVSSLVRTVRSGRFDR